MVKNILLALLFVVAMVGCNNDDDDYFEDYYGDTLIQDLPGKTYVPDDVFEQSPLAKPNSSVQRRKWGNAKAAMEVKIHAGQVDVCHW